MTAYRLGILHGDGIGPEIGPATQRVMETACAAEGVALMWDEAPMGHAAIEAHGTPLPAEAAEMLAGCDGFVLGPHDSASYPEPFRSQRNPSGELRKRFDLYANVRPARGRAGIPALRPQLDLVVVRENTEGFYTDRNMVDGTGTGELVPSPDVALAVGVFTRHAIERAAHVACRLATARRRRLTVVHKANIMRQSSGLFLRVAQEVAAGYPDVQVDDGHIDAMTAHLVRRGEAYDVLLAENMFGDILSDLTGELSGSLGLAGSINAGDDRAMAQAAHGSAPDIAGRGVADPVGLMTSAAMLLDWLGSRHDDPAARAAGVRLDRAVDAALAEGVRTPDLGGTAGTAVFADGVVERMGA